jgi:L-ascorbate metabolism protein UlaG (beta-lactamase superfamily)
MKITWLGHSAFRIETGQSVILIDPFLTGNSTFEGSGRSRDEVIGGATHVVLSHGHDDHVGDTVAICKQTGATLVAIYETMTISASPSPRPSIPPARPLMAAPSISATHAG